MSDATPLPARPHIDHYRKRAKALVKAGKAAALTKAHLQIAREHGFASWPRFAKHIEALARARSPVLRFEQAVDAIVAGDADTLARLLREAPSLVQARSTREHRSTLLHYVSANGVEDFRQKTPKNIVEIARMLLDGGADVNAESDAYGGRSTALNLTGTSVHPAVAGVQIDLMQLLLDRGAIVDRRDVVSCLRNGRGPAAQFLAANRAPLDLEGAAGVGRLDLVRAFFDRNGALARTSARQQMLDGFAWACSFGRTDVVEFLLHRGVPVGAKLKHHGQTGLHTAAGGGFVDTVQLLLDHHAPVDGRDGSFGGTAIGWALYGWSMGQTSDPRADYCEVVRMLIAAGVPFNPELRDAEDDIAKKVRGDARMSAAIQGHLQRPSG